MKTLSQIALSVRPSATLAIDAMYKQMRQDGVDVVGFGAGEPDFSTPDFVKLAGIQSICQNYTKYTPSVGTMELREAIGHRIQEDTGVGYRSDEIVVSNGAKTCIYAALRTLLDPGDEVLLPVPYYVSYIELIRMAGGVPVLIQTREGEGFKVTAQQLREAITAKTKCLILNHPSNPTGMVYTRNELESLAQVCEQEDLYVISDEIYGTLVYDGREFISFSAVSSQAKMRTIIINGVSKTYAMTGWRIGYAAASREIAKVLGNYLGHCTGSPCAISQQAAKAALLGEQSCVKAMRDVFARRRDDMFHAISNMDGVRCLKPEGAFYLWMNISELIGQKLYGQVITDGDHFARLLLERGNVAVVPGFGFGCREYVRWSYAVSDETIHKGMERLRQFLKEG